MKILARAELELFFEVEKCVREGARAHVRILSKSYNIFCLFFLEEEHETARITEKQNYKTHNIHIHIIREVGVGAALLVLEERLGARER